MAQPRAAQYKRVGDYDKTFGEKLDEIEGKDVILHSYSVGQREMTRDGETGMRTFVIMEISDEADSPVRTYHAWSDSVAEKLTIIEKEHFPLVATFSKVTTGSGRTVWDVK